jgi:hypothetical protein
MAKILTLMGMITVALTLASCGGDGGSDDRTAPPPMDEGLVWDQDNWNEREWE